MEKYSRVLVLLFESSAQLHEYVVAEVIIAVIPIAVLAQIVVFTVSALVAVTLYGFHATVLAVRTIMHHISLILTFLFELKLGQYRFVLLDLRFLLEGALL